MKIGIVPTLKVARNKKIISNLDQSLLVFFKHFFKNAKFTILKKKEKY